MVQSTKLPRMNYIGFSKCYSEIVIQPKISIFVPKAFFKSVRGHFTTQPPVTTRNRWATGGWVVKWPLSIISTHSKSIFTHFECSYIPEISLSNIIANSYLKDLYSPFLTMTHLLKCIWCIMQLTLSNAELTKSIILNMLTRGKI